MVYTFSPTFPSLYLFSLFIAPCLKLIPCFHFYLDQTLSFVLDYSMNAKTGPKLNIRRRSFGSDKLTMPKKLPLNSLICHFNWGICKITPATLQERILSVEGHIKENSCGILPQSLCLLAYLKSKLVPSIETNNEIYDILLQADQTLPELDQNSIKDGLGYKAVVIANLTFWESKLGKHEQAKNHFKYYNDLQERYGRDLERHPEVLAMKGFAFGYSFGYEKSRDSVSFYTEALSDTDYINNAEWLYGLAHSKSVVALKEEPQKMEDLTEIELLFRRAIHIDPKYSLAMLKLAKTLVKLNGLFAFEEAEHWIERALNVSDRKLSCLEEAASIYQLTVRDRKSNNRKAMKLYEEAEDINPTSKRTILGLGKCYLSNYFDNKRRLLFKNKKLQYINVPPDLQKAREYFEKDSKHKRHTDRLKLAQVYNEMSLFEGKEEFRKKAENIFKQVVSLSEVEQDPLRLVEAYTRYATFLKKEQRFEEEIEYLKKAVDVTVDDDNEEEFEMRFARECQDRLLIYASQGQYMKEKECLAVKGHVQGKRGNIITSCFYLEEAVKLNDPETSEEYERHLKENLAECMLCASQLKLSPYTQAMTQIYFDKAKSVIADLAESERKYELQFDVAQLEINELMGPVEDDQLKMLKKYLMHFEICRMKTNKQRLERVKKVRFSVSNEDNTDQEKKKEEKEEEEEELEKVLDVITESRRILDRSMNIVKEQIFQKEPGLPPSCYYPTPKSFTLNVNNSLEQQMQHLLEKRFQLTDFRNRLPNLFNFLVKKQEYKWLQDVIHIRNEREHTTESKDLLKKTFPTREEQKSLVNQISQYSVEIWNRIQLEVFIK